MESDAAGVQPNQVEQAQKRVAELGVPTEYNPQTGNPIFTSRKHRKEFCEAVGLFDRNGGYGDPQRNHSDREES